MRVMEYGNEREKVAGVKALIKSAGNQIFSVHFIARGTGKKRKMSCRLQVRKPQYVHAPTLKNSLYKKDVDLSKDLLTVYDTNCLRYDDKDRLNGRGSYKSIPLNSVTRIAVGGEIYRIVG